MVAVKSPSLAKLAKKPAIDGYGDLQSNHTPESKKARAKRLKRLIEEEDEPCAQQEGMEIDGGAKTKSLRELGAPTWTELQQFHDVLEHNIFIPDEVGSSAAFAFSCDEAKGLGQAYSQWVTKAELFHAFRDTECRGNPTSCVGRKLGPHFTRSYMPFGRWDPENRLQNFIVERRCVGGLLWPRDLNCWRS